MKIAVPFWRRLAIAVWCIALNPTFVVPAAAARNFGAEIADVSGPAFVIPKGTNNILNAAKGQRLAPGDVITTGLEGEAELLYDDGNLTRLDENSRLLIEKLSVVEGGARETGIRLDLGRVKNAVSKLGNKRSHFEVHTSSAVAGVTGTPDWVVGLAGDPASPVTEVDLLGKTGEAGEIFVEGAGGAGRQAITSGMRSVVRPGMPPATPFSIDPERAEMLMRKMPLKTPKELRDLKRMELDKSSGVTQPSPEAASAPPPAASSGVPAGTEVAKSAAGAAALGAAGSAAGAAAGVAGAAGMVAGTAAGLAAGGKNEAAKVEAKAVPEKAETPKPQQPPLGSAEKAPVETAPAPRTAAVRLNLLAGGEAHSVFLKGDGTLWAWGQNNKGQLGDGTDDRRLTPVQVKGPGGKGTLQGIVAVAAGSLHTVAVKNDGTVWAWGYNDDGQLGDGSDDDRETPVQVKGPGGQGPLEGMVAVAAGSSHTLALRKDGTVWAWGKNNKGQLGDDTGDDRETPVLVKGLKGIVAIAAGADHSLALKGDGTLWSWGKNESGQIGDKSVINRLAPVWVKAISGAAAIAAGENHSVALKGDGTVWSWGSNNAGQLGISEGTGTMRLVPVFVDGLSGITAIGAGSNHTFALKSDGTLWTWGSNSKGQLGDDSRDDRMVPAQVSIP